MTAPPLREDSTRADDVEAGEVGGGWLGGEAGFGPNARGSVAGRGGRINNPPDPECAPANLPHRVAQLILEARWLIECPYD
jgi:hypothetical protein